MPNSLSRLEVKRLALLGAQSRLAELRTEIANIVRAFPELGRASETTSRAPRAAAAAAAPKRARRRNFQMSDAQKKAVSERMKKYWAARRKEKGKKA